MELLSKLISGVAFIGVLFSSLTQLINFFRALFGDRKKKTLQQPASKSKSKSWIARRFNTMEKPGPDQLACIFKGSLLCEVTDHLSSTPLSEEETYWLVPKNPCTVPVSFPSKEEGKEINSELQIQFEPEMDLGSYLLDKEYILRAEFENMIQAEFRSLLELTKTEPCEILEWNEEQLETLRARLSVFILSNGLRCTGIKPFKLEEIKLAAPEEISAEINELGDRAEEELTHVAASIKRPEDWNRLKDVIHIGGLPNTQSVNSRLDAIGTSLLEKRLTSQECAHQIRQLAEETARDSNIPAPEFSFWSEEALRNRLSRVDSEMPEIFAEAPNANSTVLASDSSQNASIAKSQRPKKSFFDSKGNFDVKLREFLQRKVASSMKLLEEQKFASTDFRVAARYRSLEGDLEVVQRILNTLPKLDARKSDFQVDCKTIAETLASLNMAISAAEYLEGLLKSRELTFDAKESDIRSAIHRLTLSLEKRQNFR